jgi:hypothetical protein
MTRVVEGRTMASRPRFVVKGCRALGALEKDTNVPFWMKVAYMSEQLFRLTQKHARNMILRPFSPKDNLKTTTSLYIQQEENANVLALLEGGDSGRILWR